MLRKVKTKRLTRDYDWSSIFIELSLRAVRRVHYDYGPWGVGRPWTMQRSETHRINTGQAIELADEPAVCAAITQEIIGSSAVAGRWIKADGEEEERYFQIEREKSPHKLVLVDKPSFIEAKRARIWTVRNFYEADVRPASTDQVRLVQSDIKKLRAELRFRKSTEQPIHSHLLVWGLYDMSTRLRQDHPITFFRRLGDNRVELHQVRWLPVAWPHFGHRSLSSSTTIRPPTIERWLWIALAEVFETDDMAIRTMGQKAPGTGPAKRRKRVTNSNYRLKRTNGY